MEGVRRLSLRKLLSKVHSNAAWKITYASNAVKALLGKASFQQTDDRRVLENIIFPYFLQQSRFRNVLFIGCEWYTKGYNHWFESHKKNLWTLEVKPWKRVFGAKQHIIGSMQDMSHHFTRDSIDLIICNGVFGWGLNDKPDVEAAFQACFYCIRPGGVLIIGWNDVEKYRPFNLEDCKSLVNFEALNFPPLQHSTYLTDTPLRHTFNFYVKSTPARS